MRHQAWWLQGHFRRNIWQGYLTKINKNINDAKYGRVQIVTYTANIDAYIIKAPLFRNRYSFPNISPKHIRNGQWSTKLSVDAKTSLILKSAMCWFFLWYIAYNRTKFTIWRRWSSVLANKIVSHLAGTYVLATQSKIQWQNAQRLHSTLVHSKSRYLIKPHLLTLSNTWTKLNLCHTFCNTSVNKVLPKRVYKKFRKCTVLAPRRMAVSRAEMRPCYVFFIQKCPIVYCFSHLHNQWCIIISCTWYSRYPAANGGT